MPKQKNTNKKSIRIINSPEGCVIFPWNLNTSFQYFRLTSFFKYIIQSVGHTYSWYICTYVHINLVQWVLSFKVNLLWLVNVCSNNNLLVSKNTTTTCDDLILGQQQDASLIGRTYNIGHLTKATTTTALLCTRKQRQEIHEWELSLDSQRMGFVK